MYLLRFYPLHYPEIDLAEGNLDCCLCSLTEESDNVILYVLMNSFCVYNIKLVAILVVNKSKSNLMSYSLDHQ